MKDFYAIRWLQTQVSSLAFNKGRHDAIDVSVEVCIICYNHAEYLEECIESVISQNVSIPFRVKIYDDASTDGSAAIIKEYTKKYPNLITDMSNKTNLGKFKTQSNTIRIFKNCSSKYFCILEGDDYYTDDYKLEKQVQFLEENARFSSIAHNVSSINPDGELKHFLPFKVFGRNESDEKDCATLSGLCHLSSVMFRNYYADKPPAAFLDHFSCEALIEAVYCRHGELKLEDDTMSHYRIHSSGVFSTRSDIEIWCFHLGGFRNFSGYFFATSAWIYMFAALKLTKHTIPLLVRQTMPLRKKLLYFSVATHTLLVCSFWSLAQLLFYLPKKIFHIVTKLMFKFLSSFTVIRNTKIVSYLKSLSELKDNYT